MAVTTVKKDRKTKEKIRQSGAGKIKGTAGDTVDGMAGTDFSCLYSAIYPCMESASLLRILTLCRGSSAEIYCGIEIF